MTLFQKTMMTTGLLISTLAASTSQAGIFDFLGGQQCPNLRNDTCYVIKMSESNYTALIPMLTPKHLVKWDNRNKAAAVSIAQYQLSIGSCVEIYPEIVDAQNCN